jgi:cellulose synthase/poly-beta-1,6-N-acetylglucosamine synthase-like glycosyltransferase
VLVTIAAIAVAAVASPRTTAAVVIGACVVFYAVTSLFKLLVTVAGRGYRPPLPQRVRPGDPELPPYAVLLPVHKEANMLGHLIDRADRLMYPRRQLCILLLVEHDDYETLGAARKLRIPICDRPRWVTTAGHLRVLVIPPGGPKTKPNALNYAMRYVMDEGCEFVTIYDAEDRPEPDQLLKAVGAFRAGPPNLGCLQAELAFWNDNTNWVTALYWVGYKIHFTRFLPGLARLGLPVPLGGTSNHFRVHALRDVALRPSGDAWDSSNLTEDADLGARLASHGYRVDLLRSVTFEEAPVSAKVVDKQQRRWKAGYLQTGLVHTRKPLRSMRQMGPLRWTCFNLLVLGVPLSFLLNPLFLALTIAYFTTRSAVIAALFPAPVYYPAVALTIVGNLGVLYELVLTCLDEAEHTRGRYDLVKYMLLAQVMWLWMSRSTYIAVFELAIGKRSWHKTPHGHAEVAPDDAVPEPAPQPASQPMPRPGARPMRQLEQGPGSRPTPQPEYRPGQWPTPQPEFRPGSRPTPQPEYRPMRQLEQRPEHRPGSRPEQRPGQVRAIHGAAEDREAW